MTKRLTAAVLCLAATPAFAAGTAEARGTSLGPAQKLAKRLALKQVRGRDIVSFHVLKGSRARNGDVLFPYDDRSAKNVYCTAMIVVRTRTVGRRTIMSASFRGQRCREIPSDALAFEAAARAAQRAMRSTEPATQSAIEAIDASLRSCRRLRVPKSRRAVANLIVRAAVSEALAKPNDAILAALVMALGNERSPNPVLAGGAAGWADYVAVLRALPAIDDPCASLRAWARHRWATAAAPVNLAALVALDRRAGIDRRAIARAARLLASDGVVPNAVVGFTPDGLLFGLVAKVGITGGR